MAPGYSPPLVIALCVSGLPAHLSGALAGIIAADDVLDIIAEQLSDVVHAVERERVRETRLRR